MAVSKKKSAKKTTQKKTAKKATKKKVGGKIATGKKVAGKKAAVKKTAGRKRAASQVPDDQAVLQPGTASMKRESYFPTLIYHVDLPRGRQVSADLEKKIRALKTADPKGIRRSNVQSLGAWHSQDNLQNDPDFGRLTAIIRSACQQIFNGLGFHHNGEQA